MFNGKSMKINKMQEVTSEKFDVNVINSIQNPDS